MERKRKRVKSPDGTVCAPIPGFDGYFAGEDGSIWSTKSGKWKRRKLTPNRYLGGRLMICFTGPVMRMVHRLVLEAFIGPCPDGMECCHGAGGRLDNRLVNLRWDTPEENRLDLYRFTNGIRENHGENNGNAVLTEKQVREIIKLAKTAKKRKGAATSATAISRAMNLNKNTVWQVLKGYHWNHVTGLPRQEKWRKRHSVCQARWRAKARLKK